MYCLVVFFSLLRKSLRKPTKSAYPAPLLTNASHWFGPAFCAGPLTCHFGILTGDPRNPFLVSHLLVRFPHRKHLNDLVPPGRRTLSIRRQKNRSTRNGVLVSRKAMQNYNRFATWQNLFASFFPKTAFLTVFYISGAEKTQEKAPTHILYIHTRGRERRSAASG